MKLPIPDRFNKAWETWNLRGFILLSLSLQTLLILFAPLRKRTGNIFVIMSIWLAYLLADWAANFAVGLISNSQGGGSEEKKNSEDLLAFWASFLLIHLGGPDTITAFALEDNELWLRHFLGLIFQVFAAAYVFFQSLPNKFWISTILVFIAGIVKYAERTRALYLASLNSFRESMLKEPDPGPNYAKLMEEYSSKKEARLPTQIEMVPEPDKDTKAAAAAITKQIIEEKLNDLEVVQRAYEFFETFKGLIVDLIFSFRERNESREFFLKTSAQDAFRIIEVELNFIYEDLYTKVPVVHCMIGYCFRFISFISVVLALFLFYFQEKRDFLHPDVAITYTLLLGAIGLDTIALFMLIFSDWTVAALTKKSFSVPFTNCLMFPFVRRWSESVSTYNLIDYCLKEGPDKIITTDCLKFSYYVTKKGFGKVSDYIGIKGFLDQIKYVSKVRFDEQLRNFIFEELKMKSEIADDPETAKEISSARGDWVLRYYAYDSLLHWFEGVEYDESLLLWHIATELCLADELHRNINVTNNKRNFCKLLSDYMLYLLVMQPTMMSAVASFGQIRFRDTCAEATNFFSSREVVEEQHIQACINILDVNTVVKPAAVKGDRSKSVLFDACILAKDLKKFEMEKWDIMSKVWVELLSYAASHCRANTHAQQISKGGELVTFVWLLMAHFGLGEQFQINEGHARAKLIVGK